MEYGRNVIASTGYPLRLSADGNPERPSTGISVAWATVAPPGSFPFTVQPEGVTVTSGAYLRFGQVLTKITNQPVWTIAFGGTVATGGTFTVTLQRPDTLAYVVTAPVAWNATTAALATAIQQALSGGVALNLATTTGFPVAVGGTPNSGTANGSYTVTTPVTLVSVANGLTPGGVTMTLTQTTTPANPYGLYGPYDPAATDGRQTLTNGECVVLDQTVLQNGPMGFTQMATNHPGVITGGRVWKDRVLATNGAASLAAGPTFAGLLGVLPRLTFVEGI